MALTLDKLKAEIAAENTYKTLNQAQWETKLHERGVDIKFQDELDNTFPEMYRKKIEQLRRQLIAPAAHAGHLRDGESADAYNARVARFTARLQAKHDRLIDKLACVLKETELRKQGLVTRTPHHTDYYIDYDNGNDGNDGLSTGNAWKTITKYTTTTVRSAGDVAYLRANITWDQGTEATDINCDEDGDVDDYISIIGCDSVTNDPWSDGSDVLPIIDFEDAAYMFAISSDDFWHIHRVDFMRGADTYGALNIYMSNYVKVTDCVFRDGASSSVGGIETNIGYFLHIEGCTFHDTNGPCIHAYGQANGIIKDCSLDAGAVDGANYGLQAAEGSYFDCIDTSFAPSNAFSGTCIRPEHISMIRLRNCTFGAGTEVSIPSGGQIYSEDHDGTFESHLAYPYCREATAKIERDTGTTRVGGADSSAKMTPDANIGPNAPLILGDNMRGFARIWATASVQINISVYARVGTAWTDTLQAAECYAKFSYLSNGASAARTEVDSTEQIDNTGNWTALTSGNITPLRTGWVYIWVYLEECDSVDPTEHIFVDIKPVVS